MRPRSKSLCAQPYQTPFLTDFQKCIEIYHYYKSVCRKMQGDGIQYRQIKEAEDKDMSFMELAKNRY